MIQTKSRLDVDGLVEVIAPAVVATRAQAAAERRIPTGLVEELRAAGAFGLSTPVELGGAELSLTASMAMYEALGRLDAPVAWNVWNGNLGFAAALLAPEGVDAIWAGPADPIIANSARPAGVATPADGGYLLNGRWDIVSAIDVADWVALFALVAPGGHELRACFLRREHCTVLDTWHTAGMRATGSNTVVVDGAFVPETLTVSPFAPARIDRPLYRIPAFTIASHGAAPIVVGAAQSAIDEIVALAPTKRTDNGQVLAERAHAHTLLGQAQTSLDAARALLVSTAGALDRAAESGDASSVELRLALRAAMSHAAVVSRDVVGICRQLASSTAVYADQPIQRVLADAEVALQHMILSPTHLDLRGRALLGQDPGTPVI